MFFCLCVRSSFTSILVRRQRRRKKSIRLCPSWAYMDVNAVSYVVVFGKKNDDECFTSYWWSKRTNMWTTKKNCVKPLKINNAPRSVYSPNENLCHAFSFWKLGVCIKHVKWSSQEHFLIVKRSCEFWWNSNCLIVVLTQTHYHFSWNS